MNKQTNLREIVARHTRDVLQLFPQKARKWNAISVDELYKVADFTIEYFKDVREECIEIEKKFQKNN